MAFLQGRPNGFIPERQYDLEIIAIPPSPGGPVDAYQVKVRHNGNQVFERTYSVHSFTGGHYGMWQMVNLLQHATDIMDKKSEMQPIPLPPEAWCTAKEWPVSVYQSTTWMSIILSGSTSRLSGPGFLITVYLSIESKSDLAHDSGAAMDQFVSFPLYTTPEEVVRFGEALEAEMVKARRLRDSLNLPASFETNQTP